MNITRSSQPIDILATISIIICRICIHIVRHYIRPYYISPRSYIYQIIYICYIFGIYIVMLFTSIYPLDIRIEYRPAQIYIVMDSSLSMTASDIAPSRRAYMQSSITKLTNTEDIRYIYTYDGVVTKHTGADIGSLHHSDVLRHYGSAGGDAIIYALYDIYQSRYDHRSILVYIGDYGANTGYDWLGSIGLADQMGIDTVLINFGDRCKLGTSRGGSDIYIGDISNISGSSISGSHIYPISISHDSNWQKEFQKKLTQLKQKNSSYISINCRTYLCIEK